MVKPPALVFLATIGIPTICLVLLLLLPFFDREPGAQPAAAADRDHRRHRDDRGDGLPDDPGRHGRLAHGDRPQPAPPGFERGKEVMASSGCLGCHKIGENGNTLGPEPDRDRRPARQGRDRAHAREPDRRRCRRTRRSSSRTPSSSTSSSSTSPRSRASERGGARRARHAARTTQVRAMFDRIARVYDRMNSVMTAGMHHRWRRRAADLARVGPGDARSTWPPAPATWRSSSARARARR